MGLCPIKNCNKQTDYFLTFIIDDKESGKVLGKHLWGCVCEGHGLAMQEQYAARGRIVVLLDEREAREKAGRDREIEISNWGKGERRG